MESARTITIGLSLVSVCFAIFDSVDFDAIQAVEERLKSQRTIVNTDGTTPKFQSRLRSMDLRSDKQQESLIDIINGGTVNFYRDLDGIIKGDVIDIQNEKERLSAIEGKHEGPALSVLRRSKRKAINTEFNIVEKWENAELIYQVQSSSYSDVDSVRNRIRNALIPIEQSSCVKFKEISPDESVSASESTVLVSNLNGACSSVIGRIPNRNQQMSLALPCQVTGTIQHEFLHALGFGHEHEQPRRDDYVRVNSKYILRDYIRNFDKEPAPTYYSDLPYDFSSVMHYALNQFSIDTSANTLELVDPYLTISALNIGQRFGISWLDEVAVNKYYNCGKDCNIVCENGGYARRLSSGVCQCFCPPGLSGSTCTTVTSSCGRYVDLTTSGGTATITSSGYDGVTAVNRDEICYFFIRGSGYLELTFNDFDIKCDNYLEIRAFEISQPALGLCGTTEPAPIKTMLSPTPGVAMLIYDSTKSSAPEKGWSVTVTSHDDACLNDPCHGATCLPDSQSAVGYKCIFPDYPFHCSFDEGLLRSCDRIRFNRYYQEADDFHMAWQISSNSNPHMLTTTDITSDPQRGIATIIPHKFVGASWCLSFKYKMNGDDVGTLNVYVIKNGVLSESGKRFTKTDDTVSFSTPVNIDIDGNQFSSNDMVEVVFETLYTDRRPNADTVYIDDVHLIPKVCPSQSDPCWSSPCGDAECSNVGGSAVCSYPDTDIHCGFESNENRCLSVLEYYGKLVRQDDADWTFNEGPTLTDNTGPDAAAAGTGYIYVESNFPPSTTAGLVRSAYLRLAPRMAAQRCLSFKYHMFGQAVSRLTVQARIFNSPTQSTRTLFVADGSQGNIWKSASIDVDITGFPSSVKIQLMEFGVEWGAWTECTQTCGGGSQTRQRICNPPTNGGLPCQGPGTETQDCSTQDCPVDGVLSDWLPWGECSASCGETGTQQRTRTCKPPENGGQPCPNSPLSETQECNRVSCPVDGKWTEWSEWTTCSITCGPAGLQSRTRSCTPPTGGGQTCSGPDTERVHCQLGPCAVDGNVSPWQQWSECSSTCGGGTQTRVRTCLKEAENGGATCQSQGLEESRSCNTAQCPSDAIVSAWSDWSTCTQTCGIGTRERTRQCEQEQTAGGTSCEVLGLRQTDSCKIKDCPVDSVVGEWSEWTECSSTCGDDGIRSRSRECVSEAQNGGTTCSERGLMVNEDCNRSPCPVDAVVLDWDEWTSCSVTCGGGEKTRTRQCTSDGSNGGKACSDFVLSETSACNENECPVDGVLSQWSDWSACSVTCGDGSQERTRTCSDARNGGIECTSASLEETRACTQSGCPVDGSITNWSDWAECTTTCGRGTQTRQRQCIPAQNGGKDCESVLLQEEKECENNPCPIDGKLTEWSNWSACSKDCGTGSETRSRECVQPQHGGLDCVGDLDESRECNTNPCPVDGVWADWSSWGDCSKTCGGGIHTRSRSCEGPFNGGQPCEGMNSEDQSCNDEICSVDGQWGPWDEWQSWQCCDTGKQFRVRACVGQAGDGANCTGNAREQSDCPTSEISSCPADGIQGSWSSWSDCPVTCGQSSQRRERSCTPPTNGGKPCEGPLEEFKVCQSGVPCPVDGQPSSWSSWSSCSVTCERGTKRRTRQCIPPFHGGAPCSFPLEEVQICSGGFPSCVIEYNDWQQWSPCSTTCGSNGVRRRTRNCVGKPTCDFSTQEEVGSCNTNINCPVDGKYSDWGNWEDCSVTCGIGTQQRNRICIPPIDGGRDCIGPSNELKTCFKPSCPIDGVWISWDSWSACSQTCGEGSRVRFRSCNPPLNGGMTCQGENKQEETCNQEPCSTEIQGGIGEWGQWTSCSTATCGVFNPIAFQSRTRNCPGIQDCVGLQQFEFQRCVPNCNGEPEEPVITAPPNVPINGNWGSWSVWTSCNPSCVGTRTRTRSCNSPTPANGGLVCPGQDTQSFECSLDNECRDLTGDEQLVCEDFETSDDISSYGIVGIGSTNSFSIRSGPAPLYFTRSRGSNRIGQTGPSWAASGKNYLHFTNSRPSRSEFHFDSFNMQGGACIQFQYNSYGASWNESSNSIELVLVGTGNAYSLPLWKENPVDSLQWKSVRVSVQPRANIFANPKIALVFSGFGRFSDFGFDDLKISSTPCENAARTNCPIKEIPPIRQCGFEAGDDCSWVKRDLSGSNGQWKVWRGPTRARRTGPSSANSGRNYIYASSNGGTLQLGNLRPGNGCLRFFSSRFGSNSGIGTINVKLPSGQILLSIRRNTRRIWQSHRADNINVPQQGQQSAQIIIEYVGTGRPRGDVALDDITFTSGNRCSRDLN